MARSAKARAMDKVNKLRSQEDQLKKIPADERDRDTRAKIQMVTKRKNALKRKHDIGTTEQKRRK